MEPGTLVRVTDRESPLFGYEGVVVADVASISTDTVHVEFGKEARMRLPTWDPFDDSKCQWRVPTRPEQLELIEALSAETVAKRHFAKMHMASVEYEFVKGVPHICMIDGCANLATHYTYVNFVGRVMRLRTCVVHHGKYNLVCSESLTLG